MATGAAVVYIPSCDDWASSAYPADYWLRCAAEGLVRFYDTATSGYNVALGATWGAILIHPDRVQAMRAMQEELQRFKGADVFLIYDDQGKVELRASNEQFSNAKPGLVLTFSLLFSQMNSLLCVSLYRGVVGFSQHQDQVEFGAQGTDPRTILVNDMWSTVSQTLSSGCF